PFALVLSHFAVHEPLKGQGKDALVAAAKARAAKQGVPVNADYAALVEQLDDSTGRVLAKLKALGLEENTVVFFLSDKGGVDQPGRDEVCLQWEAPGIRRGRHKLLEFPPYVPTAAEIEDAKAKWKKKKKEGEFKPPESSRLRIELYDLEADPGETHDLSASRPE